jgi:fructose-1,6-bisphosphatase/inositol monophosphatase family enzyme
MRTADRLRAFDRRLEQEMGQLADELRHRSLHGVGLEEIRVREDGDTTHRFDADAEERLLHVFAASGLPFRFSSEERDDVDLVGDPQLLALVDPLDGSMGLARGRPGGSIAVCVVDMESASPVLSRIAEVFTGVQYSAFGGTALRGGKPIRPSGVTKLKDAVVGSYFASGSRLHAVSQLDLDWTRFGLLLNNGGLLDIAKVGTGQADAYIEVAKGFPGREYAAGLDIALTAGAVASTLERDPVPILLDRAQRIKFVVSATPELHNQMLEVFGDPGCAGRAVAPGSAPPARDGPG